MRARISALLLALVVVVTGTASAQETTGKIAGKIVDSQGLAVPGATVTVTGPQGAKSAVTDGQGEFVVSFLVPASYSVKSELQGFKTAETKDVAVSLGKTTSVDLQMSVGSLSEVVEVTGAAAVVDTRSTTIGSVVSSQELRQIPVGRTFSATLYLTPGVSSSGTLGTANPSIGGASGLENQYVIDGANVTNTGYGGLGSYSITHGSLGNATPFDFIQEVQVKTGGYEAEYGQATGGVVNVVTKSGSNQLRGSVFGYTQPPQLEAAWKQYQAANGSVNVQQTMVSDGGAEAGGALVQNKLFWFGAIDPSRQVRTLAAPPGFPLASRGNVDRVRTTMSYAAKATWQVTNARSINASFFGDPSHGPEGPQRTSALLATTDSSYSTLDYGGHQQAIRYSGAERNNWLIEGSFARSRNSISELPKDNTWRVTNQTVTPTVITGGIGSYEAGNVSLSKQWSAKSTHLVGSHAIKYGFQYDDVTYSQLNQRTGPTFKAPDGRQTATGASITVLSDVNFGKIYRVTRANFNTSRTIPQTYVNVFGQDEWRLGRATINAGVRYEQETLSGTIIKDWQLKNNWAPRLGMAYDVNGDGRTKVYGSYGVFFARIPMDLAARALSADDGFSRGDYFDANLTQPVPQGVATITPAGAVTTNHFVLAGVGADTIDPKTKLTYTNEIVAGVEREIGSGTTFTARYIFRNMPRVLEDVANCPMAAYDLGPTSVPCGNVEYILTNPSSDTPINADVVRIDPRFASVKFDNPVHRYNALELVLRRRAGNWTTLTSYRYSRLRGNFEGFYRDDNGQSDPGISSLYDFPTGDPTYKSIGVNQLGYGGDIVNLGDKNGILPLDRPHQVKVSGSYMVTPAFNMGLNLNLSSGKPLTPMAANPNYASNGEIPEAPRGSGIKTIDGFMKRTPFESQVDLQASYSLRMNSSRKLSLVADIFNLFNQRRVRIYSQNTQLGSGTPDPDLGKPVNTLLGGNPAQFQAPIAVRLGARFEF